MASKAIDFEQAALELEQLEAQRGEADPARYLRASITASPYQQLAAKVGAAFHASWGGIKALYAKVEGRDPLYGAADFGALDLAIKATEASVLNRILGEIAETLQRRRKATEDGDATRRAAIAACERRAIEAGLSSWAPPSEADMIRIVSPYLADSRVSKAEKRRFPLGVETVAACIAQALEARYLQDGRPKAQQTALDRALELEIKVAEATIALRRRRDVYQLLGWAARAKVEHSMRDDAAAIEDLGRQLEAARGEARTYSAVHV